MHCTGNSGTARAYKSARSYWKFTIAQETVERNILVRRLGRVYIGRTVVVVSSAQISDVACDKDGARLPSVGRCGDG